MPLQINRRKFVKAGSVGVGAIAIASQAKATSSMREKLCVGGIGAGGRAASLLRTFQGVENVEVTMVCDPDQQRREEMAKGLNAKPVDDLRKILDDKTIDAVAIATPDHWHAPAALLALQAGKHVYVEKPCSHNVREGRLLVDAARKYKLHVQHGTQSRSNSLIASAIQALREDVIGEVKVAKAWNVQQRGPIGKEQPGKPPAGFDYDQWLGPAPAVPFQKNRFHYTWHWWYDFGTGDTGNDGVHELDIARWGLGIDTHPSLIAAIGGKSSFDDEQQFPDTQYATFEYPGDGSISQRKQLVFEMRLWSKYGMDGADNGNAFYGTDGWMLLSKRGFVKVFDRSNNQRDIKLPEVKLVDHTQNFIDTIRGEGKLTAEIEVGHLSAALCHLANISTRVRRSLNFDPNSETIKDDKQASALLTREYREDHWAVPDFG